MNLRIHPRLPRISRIAVKTQAALTKPSPRTSPRSGPRQAVQTPELDLYFLRAHTHGMLRRYLYTSLQTCRIGSTLDTPIGRGWVTSRPIVTFEDALIFVHDMERAIASLPSLDRDVLTRVVLQEWTHEETGTLLGMCTRTVASRLAKALDLLSQKLISMELLILPEAA